MELDLARFREKLLARRRELLADDQMSEGDRAPVRLAV